MIKKLSYIINIFVFKIVEIGLRFIKSNVLIKKNYYLSGNR